MLEEIENLTDYLKIYSNTLAEKIKNQAGIIHPNLEGKYYCMGLF